MKTKCISLSELNDYLKYVSKEAELKVKMTQLLHNQQRSLELIQQISDVAKSLKMLKSKVEFKYSEEVNKAIKKYAGWC